MAHPNPVDLAAALVKVPAQNFIFLKIAGYRKCHEVVVDKNGPTMVACKRIPPNENTRPEASRDIEKNKKRPATLYGYTKKTNRFDEKRNVPKMKQLVPPFF